MKTISLNTDKILIGSSNITYYEESLKSFGITGNSKIFELDKDKFNLNIYGSMTFTGSGRINLNGSAVNLNGSAISIYGSTYGIISVANGSLNLKSSGNNGSINLSAVGSNCSINLTGNSINLDGSVYLNGSILVPGGETIGSIWSGSGSLTIFPKSGSGVYISGNRLYLGSPDIPLNHPYFEKIGSEDVKFSNGNNKSIVLNGSGIDIIGNNINISGYNNKSIILSGSGIDIKGSGININSMTSSIKLETSGVGGSINLYANEMSGSINLYSTGSYSQIYLNSENINLSGSTVNLSGSSINLNNFNIFNISGAGFGGQISFTTSHFQLTAEIININNTIKREIVGSLFQHPEVTLGNGATNGITNVIDNSINISGSIINFIYSGNTYAASLSGSTLIFTKVE